MEPTPKRLRKIEAIIIGVVVLAALVGWYLINGRSSPDLSQAGSEAESNYAVVSIDGNTVEVIRLADHVGSEAYFVDLRQWDVEGKLELKEGKIRFIEVSCPDHICEEQGFIGQELQSAVCMPNRVAVSIYSDEDAKQLLSKVKK